MPYSHQSCSDQVPRDNSNNQVSEDENIHTAVPATVENDDDDDDESENKGLGEMKTYINDSFTNFFFIITILFSVFIPGKNIILGEVLGEGEFGAVYKGVYNSKDKEIPVAIKMLRDTHNTATRDEFLREAKLMVTFNHHCVVKCIGFSEGPPLLMVMLLNLLFFLI